MTASDPKRTVARELQTTESPASNMLLNRFKPDWKYALGEVFLIAIGVLIALAVDGWREYQAERKLEAEYIGRIENDLQSALLAFDSDIALRESAIELLEQMRNGKTDLAAPGNAEDVWGAYMVTSWFGLPAIRSSAFEELVSTGRLSFIEGVALRDSMSNFYSTYFSLAEKIAWRTDQSYSHFIRSNFPHEVFQAAQVSREYDVARINAGLEELRLRPEFDDLSNAALTRLSGDIRTIEAYKGFAVELVNEIAEYKNR